MANASQARVQAPWAWLGCGAVLFGVMASGAVDPVSGAVMYTGLGVACVWGALTLTAPERMGTTLQALRPVWVVLGALVGSGLMAPRPDLLLDAVGQWGAVAVVVWLTAAWSVQGVSRRPLEGRMAWAVAALGALGAAHAWMGWTAWFGVLEVRTPFDVFWAPMVNPNHYGTLMLMGLPLVLRHLRRSWRSKDIVALVVMGVVVVWTLLLPVVIRSAGLALAMAGVGVVAVWTSRSSRSLTWGMTLAAVGAAGLGLWLVIQQQPEWWRLSGGQRVLQWSDTLRMIAAHPWGGVGPGAYGEAYPAWQTVPEFAVFAHAHSDLLEWLAETGLVGGVGLVAAVWMWPRPQHQSRAWAWQLAAAGGLLHGAVDFPLALPALACVVAGLATMGTVGFERPQRSAARGVRATGVGLGVVLMLSAVWSGFRATEHATAERVLTTASAEDVGWLQTYAPWRAEGVVAEVKKGASVATLLPQVEARHGRNAELHRVLALAARAEGEATLGWRLLEESRRLAPMDFRTPWVMSSWHQEDGEILQACERRAEALQVWPRQYIQDGEPLREAFSWLPIGGWWVEALHDAPAHWNLRLAWLLMEEDEPFEALAAARRASVLRPAAFAYTPVAARAMVALGQEMESRAYVARWLAEHPEAPWAWSTRAEEHRRDGKHLDAMAAYYEAWVRLPHERRFAEALGEVAQALVGSDDVKVEDGAERPARSLARAHALGLADQGGDCLMVLGSHQLLEHPRFGEVAASLAKACRSAEPSVTVRRLGR